MKKKLLTLLSVILIALLAFSIVYPARINILVLGIEGTRTDTMILFSLDLKDNEIDAISIPRDTYFPTDGHNGLGQKKLNALYGFKENGGSKGVTAAIESILTISIDYCVTVDYEAVKALTNLIGGVEVDVPFDMSYDDPYANPPLHIDIKKGVQTLYGDDVIGYLRFRKSNDGSIREGDVQRIERQQTFLKSAVSSAISPKLPHLILKGLSYVESDLPSLRGISYAIAILGINENQIYFHTLPENYTGKGEDGLSYFFYDQAKTSTLVNQIYSSQPSRVQDQ